MKTLATYSIKGGVGKTSAAVNLGALAAADGQRTVLWDLDPQGAASFLFRIKPKVKGGGKRLLRERDPLAVMKGTDIEGLDLLPADSQEGSRRSSAQRSAGSAEPSSSSRKPSSRGVSTTTRTQPSRSPRARTRSSKVLSRRARPGGAFTAKRNPSGTWDAQRWNWSSEGRR